MTVLVTGGTGYVAGWVIAELLDRGYDVRMTVRSLDKARQMGERERLTFAVADLTRAITVSLGRRNRHSTAKAERVLGWKPRPAAETVVDCARSLIAWGVVPASMGAS